MAASIPREPTLFTAPEAPDVPALKGVRCSCGYVFFPPQDYGCEKCGAEPSEFTPVELAGRGTLQGFATVHRQKFGDMETPFTVGSILLEEGVAIMGLLTCRTDQGLAIGQPAQAALVEMKKDKEGNSIVDCRFTPQQSTEGAD